MADDIAEKLIAKVQKNPPLFDNFVKDTLKKMDIWKTIGHTFGINSEKYYRYMPG